MRAIPPPKDAMRSVHFSLSKSVSAASASRRNCVIRALMLSCCFPSMTMVVCSLAMTMRSAVPSMSKVTESRVIPSSSATKEAPVAMAISCVYSRRLFPNPGALMATTSKTPRILLTTRAESASPVTSSAMIKSGSLLFTSCSRRGTTSLTSSILASVTRMRGFMSSATCRSWSLTKYGEMYPLSMVRPSVNSISSNSVWDSSTTVDPVSPTLSAAWAMMRPISKDPEAMLATLFKSSIPETGVASSLTLSLTKVAAFRIPRLRATGLMPAVTALIPLFTIAFVMIVDVVVPSPALESLLEATSWMRRAPTFSSGSLRLISLAIVTPSLTISGAP
mmetsp:Transcript_8052/g.23149  ORF Transcript_8052/g.23149 Transcript_8052/m.23149 type:complete len:335 (+) Transcript_8052:324-1328(+)